MNFSTIPAPPSSAHAITLAGWIPLHRPATLTPEVFHQSLVDLAEQKILEWTEHEGGIFVRWIPTYS